MDPKILEELERLAPDYEFAREALELLRGNDELMRQEQEAAARAAKKQTAKVDTPIAEALSNAA